MGKKAISSIVSHEAGFSRAQLFALLVALLQLLTATTHILPLGPDSLRLYWLTGILGLVLSLRHLSAILYGAGLVLIYGALTVAEIKGAPAFEEEMVEIFSYGRAAVAGLIIISMAFVRRTEP